MATTLLFLLVAWAVTVPVVLGVARLLGRLTSPRLVATDDGPAAPEADVVPLVARGRNRLVPADELRRAA